MALAAGGPVRDIADGIDRLVRGAGGGDEDAAARERAVGRPKQVLQRRNDVQRLGHAPGAGLPGLRHLAPVRADESGCVGRQIASERRVAG